jgi:hypothetical protein
MHQQWWPSSLARSVATSQVDNSSISGHDFLLSFDTYHFRNLLSSADRPYTALCGAWPS